jgi:hypothetical protein
MHELLFILCILVFGSHLCFLVVSDWEAMEKFGQIKDN